VNFGFAPGLPEGCMKAVAEAALAALEEPESTPQRLGSAEGCSDGAAQASLRLSLMPAGEEIACTATRTLEQQGARPRQEGRGSATTAREACAAALAALPPL
jgi:hypothetical protein